MLFRSDRVVCTDFSRRKLKYKNENGDIVTDPELTNLSESLFKSIKERNKELAMQYTKELTERFASMGFETQPGSPEALGQKIKLETEKWAKAIKAAGMEAE